MKNTSIDTSNEGVATLDFEATDVTGSVAYQARGMRPGTPVSTVAAALASRMQLPADVPWTLRSDRTGALLDEDIPIGDQIESGSRVVMTPKSHLG